MPHRTLPDRISGPRADPSSAMVTVDGEYYGTSPIQGSALPRSDPAAGWRQRFRPTKGGSSAAPRGQSLVEFALVLPLLLVLLLGVADFGRVFAAGITIEAATRNAAEVGAIERLRNPPPLPPGDLVAYYQALHVLVAKTACAEARLLPNSTFDETNRTCASMPVVRVCVRDGQDPLCGAAIPGFASGVPSQCSRMGDTWSNASGGAAASHSVEVRVCYRFTTLFNLHMSFGGNIGINLGDVWLQRNRLFVIDCPPGDVSAC